MKLKFGTRKLTFVVIRDANSSVVRFRLRSIILILVPVILLISAAVSAFTIYTLSKLYSESVILTEQLTAQLQTEQAEHSAIVNLKDRLIEQLMADVVELSTQTEIVQNRLDELQQLSDQIKQINGDPDTVASASDDAGITDKQDIMIASASGPYSAVNAEPFAASYSHSHFVNDFNEGIGADGPGYVWHAPVHEQRSSLISIFDGLLIERWYTFDLENGQGGALHEVTATDVMALADVAKDYLRQLEARMEVLKTDLEEAREIAIEYQHMLRITPSIWPTTSTRITSSFGYRTDPFTRKLSYHSGIDFGGKVGDPVYATADGKVVTSSYDRYYGHYVIVDHTNGIRTLYAHMSKRLVSAGDQVQKGDQIGKLGSTGRSTGPHLHYEVYKNGVPVNPKTYLP